LKAGINMMVHDGFNAEAVLKHVGTRLPGFVATAAPVALSGGFMNYVWRVVGRPQNIVVKYAPPYIATRPEVWLDPARLAVEARCLAAFSLGGPLAALAQPALRPPALLDFEADSGVLIQEDVGQWPDLGQWLRAEAGEPEQARQVGRLIGQFIGALHRQTYGDEALRPTFNNLTIQESRLSGQYARIAEYLERGRVPDAAALGSRALALGHHFLTPGLGLIMGDLWPPSLLVTVDGLRLIDWEFAHFGRPAQDVGHLVAHLWMHRHRAATRLGAALSQAVLDGFGRAYRQTLGQRLAEVFGPDGVRESAIHFGAEILARTVGSYQAGHLYDNLGPESGPVQEAVQVAAAHIRGPEASSIFAYFTGEP
jgi:hypothetical protein